MGHVNHEDLWQMVEKEMVTGVNLDMSSKPNFCETCIKAKAPRKPFPKESKKEYKAYGDKVVANIWGLLQLDPLVETNILSSSRISIATKNESTF
jgi:hypothetical protein